VRGVETRRFYGYVVDLKLRVFSDSIVYYLTLVDLAGNEFVVRMRALPDWLRMGIPISGELVKVVADREAYLALREPSPYEELKKPRVIRVRNIHLEQVLGGDKWILHGENVKGGLVSYPIISKTAVEKARKALGGEEAYLYVADMPSGSYVLTVQGTRQYDRYDKIEKFLRWIEQE